jgi:hypothetical protein
MGACGTAVDRSDVFFPATAMTTIQDEQLDLHLDRVRSKVVVITGRFFKYIAWPGSFHFSSPGGANGIGKEAALRFGKFG